MSAEALLWHTLVMLVVVGLPACSVLACTAVVVGRRASADGSVLLGHNEQNGGRGRFLNFRKVPRITHKPGRKVTLRGGARVPQVRQTAALLWSENPGLVSSDGYLNEWGVAVVSNRCWGRENTRSLEAAGQIVKGGISYMLRRLIAERARTARAGVQLAGELVARVGYAASQTLIIADPAEAWVLAMVPGRHWVAQRVPDDRVVILPNVHIIAEVDLTDESSFLGSPGLVDCAIRRGWYDPAGGTRFRFCDAYARPRDRRMDPRQRRGQSLVTGKRIRPTPDRQLPFSVAPARKLSVADVIAILRNQGRETICAPDVEEGAVFQLRGDLPPGIGALYWRTSAEPCTSVLTPWYVGVMETPRQYHEPVPLRRALTLKHHFDASPGRYAPDEGRAWWVFRKLQDKVRADYEKRVKLVRAVWDEFEAGLFAAQPAVEAEALKLYRRGKSAARDYLTAYCGRAALRAVAKARELIELDG
ncbi:MAG TPA: C69 family dipeptidase [Phycisphaerae bacterium]|nr:C69 family dipeptidase [Phycisphaerae bacterium]